MARETKQISVWSLNFYNSPEKFAAFVQEVTAALASVPEEYREQVFLDCDSGGYEDSAKIEAYYERPETDEEMAARLAKEREYREQQEARELAELERLKRKFGHC